MKFTYQDFSCDTEKYDLNEKSFIIKFFDQQKEHAAHQIVNYVLVDPGFGFICLKFKGEEALLSGFLDEAIFRNDLMISAAIEYVESLSPFADVAYIPHQVMKVTCTGSVEYNGEF